MEKRRSPFDVPDQGDEPLVWDPKARAFVPVARGEQPDATRAAPAARPGPAAKKQWVVGQDAVGKPLPPRSIGGAVAPPAAARHAPVAPPAPAAPAAPLPRPRPAAPVEPVAPAPAPAPAAAPARRRKRIRFLPRARWIVAFFLLVPLVLGGLGWWWASATFAKVERVPVADALDAPGGGGTNYLIVGSDSRDAVAEAGSDDPNIQPGIEGVGNERSDTMIVLRVDARGARIMSLPRDLCVDPCNGAGSRLNAAFIEGPAALIETIRDTLDVPVHRYMEVDFVTFSGLVDALGGVTIDFPHPAIDEGSGLFVGEAGAVTLDGQQALAYVRSRRYEEIIDGERVPERVPFPDVARGLRQQAFLQAVFDDLGSSRNPATLMRSAGALADGIRIDDAWTLPDAIRFAWRMRGASPVTVDLAPALVPQRVNGAEVLLLDGDAAVLDEFR